MQIESYKKVKGSYYELNLDNGEKLIVHEDLILSYELLLKKSIDQKTKENLLKENEFYAAYDDAIKLLSRKMVSVFELRKELNKKEYEEDRIDKVIKKLKDEKYLDDEKYVNFFVNDKITLSSDGPYKIRKQLQDKEIADHLIEAKLASYDDNFWQERINKLQKKYLKSQRSKSSFAAKNKLYEHLSNLGYDKSLVLSTIDMSEFDEAEAKQKEYEKQKKKLSTKYEGEELERRVRQKLYEKGFM